MASSTDWIVRSTGLAPFAPVDCPTDHGKYGATMLNDPSLGDDPIVGSSVG